MSYQDSFFYNLLRNNWMLYYLSKCIHQICSIINSELTDEVETKNNDAAGSNENTTAPLKSQSMLGEDQDNDRLGKEFVEMSEKHDDDFEDIGDEVSKKDYHYHQFLMKFVGFKRDSEDEKNERNIFERMLKTQAWVTTQLQLTLMMLILI